MADIDVERKGASIWPWIIGLIVLAALIWLLAELFTDDNEVEPIAEAPVAAPVEPAPVAAVPAAVEEFTTTCASAPAGSVSLDHQFTSDCITRLTAALDAVAENPNLAGVDFQADLQDYRQKADRLANSPTDSNQHANWTRETFTSMANVIARIQDARYPGLSDQTNQLDDAAEAIEPDRMMTDQGPAIRSFFQQAGTVMRAMATTPATM